MDFFKGIINSDEEDEKKKKNKSGEANKSSSQPPPRKNNQDKGRHLSGDKANDKQQEVRDKGKGKASKAKREIEPLPPRNTRKSNRNPTPESDILATFKPMRPKSRAVVLPSGLVIDSDTESIHTSTLSSHMSDSFRNGSGLTRGQQNLFDNFFGGAPSPERNDMELEEGIPRKKDSTIFGVPRKKATKKHTMSLRQTGTGRFGESVLGIPPQVTLHERRVIRNARIAGKEDRKSLSCLTKLWYDVRMGLTIAFRGLFEGMRDLTVWGRSIKQVEGDLGSGVSTYFRVLRWLLKINLLTLILSLGLIVIPGLYINETVSVNTTTYNKDDKVCSNPDFFNGTDDGSKVGNAVLQFLTGQGWMESTAMFIGWYPTANVSSNSENITNSSTEYNFPLAYFTVSICYFILALIFIAKNIARLFKKSAEESIETRVYSALVLNGWDYTINKKSTAQIKSSTILKSLREELFNDAQKYVSRTLKEQIIIIILRIGTNALCIGAMVGTVFLYVNQILTDTSEEYANVTDSCGERMDSSINISNINEVNLELIQQELAKFWKSYSASIIVSLSNIIFPIFFDVVGNFERYKFQSTRIGVTMFRSFVMKLFSVCTFLYILYQATKPSAGLRESWQMPNNTLIFNCWENYIGAQLYQLCIIDFIVFCINLLLSEYLRVFLVKHVGFIRKRLDKPEFNISNQTLDLCYKQMIFWSSMFFSPLMLVVAVVEIIIIFYFRKDSALRNVLPPKQVVLTSQSSTIVSVVFLVSLLFTFVFVGLVIFRFTPSPRCGPFRTFGAFSDPFDQVLDNSGVFKKYIIDNIKTTSIVITLIILALLVIYYYKSLAGSRGVSVRLLRQQVKVEKADKAFLIEMTRAQITGKPMREVKRSQSRALTDASVGEGMSKKKIQMLHRYANPNLDYI